MSLLPHHQTVSEQAEGLLSAITELEANTKENLQSRRYSNRQELNCDVNLTPGNVSDRDGTEFTGKCRDASDTGCRLVLTKPLVVGDIYLVKIDDSSFNGDMVFGRCIRCHMLREDTFECGVNFLTPVSFAPTEQADASSLIDLEI